MLTRFSQKPTFRQAFSVIEVLLAATLLGLITTFSIGSFVYGSESTRIAGSENRATMLAEEGLEAARNIRDNSFSGLSAGTFGLATSGNVWSLSGSQDVTDIFTRQIQVSDVDSDTKQVTSTVTWTQNPERNGSVVLTSYLTNWDEVTVTYTPTRSGILVYGDGGTSSDAIKYKILDGTTGLWGDAANAADVDGATANKALRSARVYASATRNEKILISRHFNGSNQFIYVQVFNGSTWGNVVNLSSWAATTYLDVQNFDGTYLSNGNFMVVYSDNTTTPKFRIWNGSAWSAASISMQTSGGIPNYIVAKARPGTNEVMAALFDQASDTNTEYFNGGTYVQASWTLHTEHSTAAPLATKRFVDFDWNTNTPTVGAMVYSESGTDKAINIKIWTANGSGGGSWSATANASNFTGRLGALSVIGRKGADEFTVCGKDASNTPVITCFESNFTPAFSTPTNNNIAPSTDTGIQKSFDIGYESVSGEYALGVYSDATVAPALKKYSAAGNSWDSSPTSLSDLGGTLETDRLVPEPDNNDIMILLADTNQDLYSVIWNGTANSLFTTPTGKAFAAHGTSGSADEEFWYDFVWNGN